MHATIDHGQSNLASLDIEVLNALSELQSFPTKVKCQVYVRSGEIDK